MRMSVNRASKKTVGLFSSAVLLAALALGGCSGSGSSSSAQGEKTDDNTASASSLTVFAAASLNKAFTDIAEKVVKPEHPNMDIKFSFEGSSTLVDQLKEGAPADVFASADEKNMTKATDANLVETPQMFAANTLVLITPADNPGQVTGMDASLDGKRLVICAQEVPCGNATKTLAEKMGMTLNPISFEQKVTDVRGKVESGEADAGLVYKTDAKAAGDKVKTFDIDAAKDVVNHYPIAQVKDAKNAQGAKIFIDAVLSDKGLEILDSYGFLPPSK